MSFESSSGFNLSDASFGYQGPESNHHVGDGVPAAAITETTDAPASVATSYAIAPGDTFQGTLGFVGDRDWVSITLTAGQSYDISLFGSGAGALSDPYLRLYDASGTLVAQNDDGGAGLNSFLSFIAGTTGTYYISAGAFNDLSTGSYTVSVTALPPLPVFTLDQIADQLTDGFWNWFWGGPTPMSFDASPGDTLTVDITGLTAEGQQLARWALAAWTAATGLLFAEVSSSSADIVFDDTGPGATGGPTTLIGAQIIQSGVNIAASLLTSGATIDSYSFQTYMHEIGHALGLGHAGNYNGSAAYGVDNHYLNDSWQATLMSYFSQTENTYIDASFAYTVTPMIADIIAIQNLYGTGVSTNAGNTVYGANSNVGGYLGDLFAQIAGEVPLDPSIYDGNAVTFTIFDTGGTDTLDLSPSTDDNRVDLRPEAISDIWGLIGNLIIARGTVIENAIGGSGNDAITGNTANNVLIGALGNDTLSGESGNDTLLGQGGNDSLLGGIGNDVLNGDAGNDTLRGGNNNDVLRGGHQEDRLYGDAGNDTLLGEAGFDYLDGGAGNDRLEGGDQADNLLGGTGNDTLLGGNGFDRLFGGDDDDLGYGGAGTDGLFGERGNDSLYGQGDNDRIFGGTGNDLIDGGSENDVLFGGAGFDTLIGSTGNDTMSGNFNADTFIFADFGGGFGQDVITDFDANNNFEKIDLRLVSSIVNFTDLAANHMTQVGGNVVIDALGGNTITLLGVNLGDLDVNDFIF